MRKIGLAAMAVLLMAGSLQAHGANHHAYDGFRHNGHYSGWGYGGWMAPLIIGGAIGYAVSRPAIVYDASPGLVYGTPRTIIVQDPSQPNLVQQPVTVSSDEPVYEERWVYFDDCQCERKVLVNIRP